MLLLFVSFWYQSTQASSIKIISKQEYNTLNTVLKRHEVFMFFSNLTIDRIPDTYKYIDLKYGDITPNDDIYDDMQRLVYIDFIKNARKNLYLNKTINAYSFYKLSADFLGVKVHELTSESKTNLKNRNAIKKDLNKISEAFEKRKKTTASEETGSKKNIEVKQAIFNDVYETLTSKHYDKAKLDKEKILDKAIQWLAEWTDDKHTVYFPPVQSKGFSDGLSWEYEGIGSYVDMKKPWVFEIVTPIAWSPSEKAGLKWWDIVTHVDGKQVTEDNSIAEVVSWIKWPAGSQVTLTISRWNKTLKIVVTRDKIVIKDIESEKLDKKTTYISMKSFWEKSSQEFGEIIKKIKQDTQANRIIIDLRNNGGWYLWQVSDMLSHFIEKDKSVAVVKYIKRNDYLRSKWYETLDLNNYRVVLLQNSWTASASEIFIWTLKDYYPHVKVVWEKSYGKWSVQTIKKYKDGSILKYTIARWYTGGSETGIDGIGIAPDLEIEFDNDAFNERGYDNQLEKAKTLR